MNRFAVWLLPLLLPGAMYLLYRQHRVQTELNAQLYQLDELLTADNDRAAHHTAGSVKGIQAGVIKNQNQPQELAVLTAAESLHSRADSVVKTLRHCTKKLFKLTFSYNSSDIT